MTRILPALGLSLLLATTASGQEQPDAIPAVERKPYSFDGFLEARPAIVWLDPRAAPFKLQSPPGGTDDALRTQLNARLQLDAGYRQSWFSVQTRTVADGGYASADWTGTAAVYEAYVSLKPRPSLTVDAGKKTLKWGKAYLWNPAAFLDRAKSPEDPALALEGFAVVSADYIRTFDGPLQVISVTPVLLPVSSDLNRSFGARGHLNVAGKLYLLLFDSDIDVMFLSGGSRPSRFGIDVSRNLWSNLEVHGEWARIPRAPKRTLTPAGTLMGTARAATSFVVGARYLTAQNTTYIIDYYRNGTGYTSAEMGTYFDVVTLADEALTGAGDETLLEAARRATEAGYGRLNPMRSYLYGRVSQPDALGVLYLTVGVSAIVNIDDGSFALLPDVQYRLDGRVELRGLANIQRGARRTEFGEKPADARVELRVRYYF
jgi:hypothetical protein